MSTYFYTFHAIINSILHRQRQFVEFSRHVSQAGNKQHVFNYLVITLLHEGPLAACFTRHVSEGRWLCRRTLLARIVNKTAQQFLRTGRLWTVISLFLLVNFKTQMKYKKSLNWWKIYIYLLCFCKVVQIISKHVKLQRDGDLRISINTNYCQ